MSEDFLRAARQEIKAELHGLKGILELCKTDEDIFRNSKDIERRLHKIKGLAPMMGHEKMGELAKMSEAIIRHAISNGITKDSCKFILEAHENLNTAFHGKKTPDIEDVRRQAKKIFPQIDGM